MWFSRDFIDLSHSDSDGDIPNIPLVVSPKIRIVELEDALDAVQQERDDAIINVARMRDEIAYKRDEVAGKRDVVVDATHANLARDPCAGHTIAAVATGMGQNLRYVKLDSILFS